jgi:hypothetical protein
LNVFRAGTFRAASFLIRDSLTDAESFDGRADDRARVEEQIASFSLDKTKTFVQNHFFNRPLRHVAAPSKNKVKKHLAENFRSDPLLVEGIFRPNFRERTSTAFEGQSFFSGKFGRQVFFYKKDWRSKATTKKRRPANCR